mmetsp:Transcript_4881/g.8332  ORF Transcript_4881/g.8332 Transcript_4881/m.8332 type:complete len:148 (+) Transcript_4881:155-598(+)
MFAATTSRMARTLSRRVKPSSSSSTTTTMNNTAAVARSGGARRNMGGGAHWMEVSPHHTMAGEVCGFFTWLWVFYRAKHDLPVVLGLRHPWEHGEDPWAIHDHVDNLDALQQDWEDFADKSTRPGEDDDEDDDDDDDDEEEEEEDDE